VILFGDETGVRENGAVGTTWGEKGARPTVRTTFYGDPVTEVDTQGLGNPPAAWVEDES
jgi:hypothetical protein